MTAIEHGTRIYSTGDMANADGFGTVDGFNGGQAHITLDDGRDFYFPVSGIGSCYAGHCSPRVVTEAAYHAYRDERMKAWRSQVPA